MCRQSLHVKLLKLILLCGCVTALGALVPSSAAASRGVTICEFAHFWRHVEDPERRELGTTFLTFMNTDLDHEANILRLTIRDLYGEVVFDGGPKSAANQALPKNMKVNLPDGLDISVIPPGATYFINSRDFFGIFPIASTEDALTGDNERGFTMQVRVEFKKKGPAKRFVVSAHSKFRNLPGPTNNPDGEVIERSRTDRTCVFRN